MAHSCTPLTSHSAHSLSRGNGKGESNIKKGGQPGFLCPGNQMLQLIITANYDGRTTKVVTTDVAASGVRQRFTYYTSNLDVF